MLGLLKRSVPMPARLAFRQVKYRLAMARNRGRNPKEVFAHIYKTCAWGEGMGLAPGTLYSGPGSREEMAAPYAAEILRYARAHGLIRIVDLGCGDFRVGRHLAVEGIEYIGVDVVDAVIEQNRRLHQRPGVEFHCLDITADKLPAGDLCLVREVFQHLSNDHIAAALATMRQYGHVIVTDNQKADVSRMAVNIDQPQGIQNRIFFGTVMDLSKPPFCVGGMEKIFEIPDGRDSIFRGFAYRN